MHQLDEPDQADHGQGHCRLDEQVDVSYMFGPRHGTFIGPLLAITTEVIVTINHVVEFRNSNLNGAAKTERCAWSAIVDMPDAITWEIDTVV
jgi:hypothetical protein